MRSWKGCLSLREGACRSLPALSRQWFFLAMLWWEVDVLSVYLRARNKHDQRSNRSNRRWEPSAFKKRLLSSFASLSSTTHCFSIMLQTLQPASESKERSLSQSTVTKAGPRLDLIPEENALAIIKFIQDEVQAQKSKDEREKARRWAWQRAAICMIHSVKISSTDIKQRLFSVTRSSTG